MNEQNYYDFLAEIYFLKTNQILPELLFNNTSDSEAVIKLVEDALNENKIITYKDIEKTLKINKNKYDLIINTTQG